MDKLYKIVWHFDSTTLSSFYSTEEKRDKAFEDIERELTLGVHYFNIGDTIMNANKVLCITKGEGEEWKSVKCH